MNIISFSGGKDSTALLLMMLEKGIPIDKIIYVDTTKEFPAMYDHIEKVQSMIEPLKIESVIFDFDYWFADRVKSRGKRKGYRGYGWPDFQNRWCTAQKRDTYKHFVASIDVQPSEIIEYHGIAFDEKHRTKKNRDGRKILYPLVEWGVTGEQALEYCYSKGLDWDGLYEQFHRVSCWCCPLSRIDELRVLYNDFPEIWMGLEAMDKKSFRRFRSNYSVAELAKKFASEQQQLTIENTRRSAIQRKETT